jgi:[glutamine synthetase] adenylyltransferase / [glutamine synthetase]-adenylyl-L-tyrosine phosphorylase
VHMSGNRQNVPGLLRQQVNEASDLLAGHLTGSWAGLAVERSEALQSSIPLVLASSLFVCNQCTQYPEVVAELVDSGRLFRALEAETLSLSLKRFFLEVGDDAALMSGLRRIRNREMLRVAWRDIAGWDDIDNILRELSLLAQVIIAETLEHLFLRAIEVSCAPLTSEGSPQRLVTLAMGKLGAYELNFSSDVDLIFAYECEGELTDRHQTSYGEFYTKLIRRFIRVLDEVTADGFVFRVDVRLRPFGQSGPLVMNFAAMETYYATQAGEWERYAMVKARAITGDQASAQNLQSMLHAFTYRRYLDYRALEELRRLKQKISAELQRKDKPEDIKLGNGGIRECEFIAQAFQLIRGGQEPRLQERSIILVLTRLGELGYLPQSVSTRLIAHYRFLRTVENRIQQYADQHTHSLPNNEKQQLAMAYALGFSDWAMFKACVDDARGEVHHDFEQTFALPETTSELTFTEAQPWLELDDAGLQGALSKLGYVEPSAIQSMLSDFFRGAAVKKLTRRGREALNRLFPLLLSKVVKQEPARQCLIIERLLQLFEVIATRNVYYTLLIENSGALARLVELAASSAWVVRYIAEQPILLDELLDNRQLYAPLSRQQLRDELNIRLAQADKDDVECMLTVLRQFKQANVLRIAAADIAGIIPLMVVSDYLTWLAEVLVEAVLAQAWRVTALRHDISVNDVQEKGVQGFAVIAYGKMGGIEMGYGSDLDLVYLYDDALSPEVDVPSMFYAKLAQRMIGMLSAQMLSGRLYEVDLRLRPSGNSGLLVSSMSAYEHYQLNNAWVWELQALVRARWVAGDQRLETMFKLIRARTLAHASSLNGLRLSILEMREKMRAHLLSHDATRFDLKQGSGGVVDIEFIVQFGVLQFAAKHPELLQYTDAVRLLDVLGNIGYLNQENSTILRQAYCLFRERIHSEALLDADACVPATEYSETRAKVSEIWRQIMAG